MKKIAVALCAMVLLVSCSEQKQAVVVPDFERLEHVEQCIPALLALDIMANEAAGSQVGERVSGAPWLRINRRLIDQRNSTALNPKSLGPVIMPMLALAQQGLSAEIGSIDDTRLKTWQAEFDISQTPQEFVQYCSRESAFAQWRDPENTIPFVQGLALAEPAPKWWHWLSPKTDAMPEREKQTWHTYQLAAQSTQSVSVVKDINGTKSVGSEGEMALLERYAPAWQVANEHATLISWQVESGQPRPTEATKAFAYVDYAHTLNTRLIRLNYVSWWRSVKGDVSGLLYRVNIGFNGRPIAFETVQLSGQNYRLFLTKDVAVHALPDYFVESTVKGAAKMQLKLSGWPLDVQAVEPLSGTVDPVNYTLEPVATLYQLPEGTKTVSLFNESGILNYQQPFSRLKSWFSGIDHYGSARSPQRLVIDPQQGLYFDQPDLLTQFRISKVYQPK